jgi:hypothetical protein
MALAVLLLAGDSVFAQEGKIFSGVVMDSLEKTPVEKCSVWLVHEKDSTRKTSTNDKGHFSFRIKNDSSVLHLRHISYNEKTFPLVFSKENTNDTIWLVPANKQLDDILITASVPPVVIHGDTTEFNIDSSMFEPYDAVEDLVKRIPGLMIDEEGKMTYQGKLITRILVDGEDLFGGDPNFSMKKLPAGMVAKIQVMDTKTLEEIFNGTPVDSDDKTLNIKLKPGNKTFGSAEAMAGTKNQLEANANISQFDKSKRLSAVASKITSNKIGFPKINSAPSSSAANASINYGNTWGGLRMNSSYSYNENGNSNEMYRERTQLITADTSFLTKSGNRSNYESNGHRFNLTSNWLIDSTSNLDANISLSKTKSHSQNSSFSTTSENGSLRNQSFGNSSSTGDYQNFSATMIWLKRFNRKGRSLTINARTVLLDNETNFFTQSTNTYFKGALAVNGDTLHRHTKAINDTRTYSINIAYFEPISRTLRLSIRSDFDFNNSTTNRSIYNLDSITHTATFDSLYSAKIFSSANTQNLGLSLVYNKEKLYITTGFTTVLQQTLRTLQNDDVKQNLLRYAPALSVSYTISKQKSLRVNFSANTSQPNIDQLQPVPDNSNPLFIRLGNPDLRTAFAQDYSASYHYANGEKSMNAGLSYAPINNQIVNAIYYDEFRKQTSRFINVNGVYAMRGSLTVSKTKREEKKFNTVSLTSSGDYSRNVFFQSNSQYFLRSYSVRTDVAFTKGAQTVRSAGFTIGLGGSFNRNWTPGNTTVLNTARLGVIPKLETSYNFGNLFISAGYQMWYNKFDYNSTLRKNDEYSIHHFNHRFHLQLMKKVFVQGNVMYQYNTRVPVNTPKGMLTANFSAAANVLKGGQGRITITAADLFGQTSNLRRVVGENFIDDMQINNLRNYYTLRFQYNFNKLERRPQGIKRPVTMRNPQ